MVGFLVLILGQLVYGGLLKLPVLFAYPEVEVKPDFVGPASSLNLLSPISVRGDLICSVRPSLQPSPIDGRSPASNKDVLRETITPQLLSPAAGA